MVEFDLLFAFCLWCRGATINGKFSRTFCLSVSVRRRNLHSIWQKLSFIKIHSILMYNWRKARKTSQVHTIFKTDNYFCLAERNSWSNFNIFMDLIQENFSEAIKVPNLDWISYTKNHQKNIEATKSETTWEHRQKQIKLKYFYFIYFSPFFVWLTFYMDIIYVEFDIDATDCSVYYFSCFII